MTQTKTPEAPKMHRSGHCGLRNPPAIHAQCRGLYSGYPCHCECHTTPEPAQARLPALTLEDAVAAELDWQIEAMDLQDCTYDQFLQATARAVIGIVQNDRRDTNYPPTSSSVQEVT
jgi:hypothetical protein